MNTLLSWREEEGTVVLGGRDRQPVSCHGHKVNVMVSSECIDFYMPQWISHQIVSPLDMLNV